VLAKKAPEKQGTHILAPEQPLFLILLLELLKDFIIGVLMKAVIQFSGLGSA
jgi:hypothetical protein